MELWSLAILLSKWISLILKSNVAKVSGKGMKRDSGDLPLKLCWKNLLTKPTPLKNYEAPNWGYIEIISFKLVLPTPLREKKGKNSVGRKEKGECEEVGKRGSKGLLQKSWKIVAAIFRIIDNLHHDV